MRPERHNPSANYPFPTRPPIPPEHGGWAMLLVSMALGIQLSPIRNWMETTFIVLGLVFLYVARYPLTLIAMRLKWLHLQDKNFLPDRLIWFSAYLTIFIVALWRPLSYMPHTNIGILAGIGLLLIAFEMITVANQQQKTLWSEVIGSTAVAFLGSLALALSASSMNERSFILWLLLVLHFVPGVFYIRMRIRSTRSDTSLPTTASKIIFALLALTAAGVALGIVATGVMTNAISPVIALAVGITLPRLFFGIGQLGKKFQVKQLGWSEVCYSIAFAIIVSIVGI